MNKEVVGLGKVRMNHEITPITGKGFADQSGFSGPCDDITICDGLTTCKDLGKFFPRTHTLENPR